MKGSFGELVLARVHCRAAQHRPMVNGMTKTNNGDAGSVNHSSLSHAAWNWALADSPKQIHAFGKVPKGSGVHPAGRHIYEGNKPKHQNLHDFFRLSQSRAPFRGRGRSPIFWLVASLSAYSGSLSVCLVEFDRPYF